MKTKTVLITGAGGGIGSAVAVAFAKQGARLALNYYKSEERTHRLAQTLSQSYGIQAQAFGADVSDRAQVEQMFEQITKRFSGVDILVNNAGASSIKLCTDLTEEEYRRIMGVNLDGTFYCCQSALASGMIKNHSGSILNISSMWGQTGASCEAAYSAAKAGVIGLTKALAKEVAPSGIRVNCICPGAIETQMLSELDEDAIDRLREETPIGRLGTPKDVAEAALFLCGGRSGFITGQVLGVNGGMVI